MDQHAQPGQPAPAESFPTDPTGLPEATRPALLELADGDDLHLQIGPVAKRLEDTTVRMLGYNGSIPGPTLKVKQGSEVIVHVEVDASGVDTEEVRDALEGGVRGQVMTARLPPTTKLHIDDTATLHLDGDQMHLFDLQTGLAIR